MTPKNITTIKCRENVTTNTLKNSHLPLPYYGHTDHLILVTQ